MPQLQIKTHSKEIHFFPELIPPLTEPLNMALIEGGAFQMGSPKDEVDRQETESPQHEVTLPSFFMSAYPITQAQWSVIAKKSKVKIALKHQPSHFKNRDLNPVESINWFEAVEFCDRLSAFTNRKYRLPSEAEWEYACRAGSKKAFSFGATITTDVANYQGKSTTPANKFLPNAYGLYDMHGNVWEWCLDHWHNSYDGAPTDGMAWLSTNKNTRRLIRGGSWDYNPRNCRSATRYLNYPDISINYIGFRVVCEIPRTS